MHAVITFWRNVRELFSVVSTIFDPTPTPQCVIARTHFNADHGADELVRVLRAQNLIRKITEKPFGKLMPSVNKTAYVRLSPLSLLLQAGRL